MNIPYIAAPPFLNFFHSPPLLPPLPLLYLLPCFSNRMCDCPTSNVTFCLMIQQTYACQALVPWYQVYLALCFMQQAITFTVAMTHMTWVLLALNRYHTHKQNKQILTQHTQGRIDWYIQHIPNTYTTCYMLTIVTCIILN